MKTEQKQTNFESNLWTEVVAASILATIVVAVIIAKTLPYASGIFSTILSA